ncbi:MAG: hypothetical protein ACTHMM_19095 [Agriterribacter sp.]
MSVLTFSKTGIFLTAAAVICAISCKKDSDDNSNTSALTATITAGNWRITQFMEDNVDETAHFSGYTFSFNQSGNVTAVRESNTVSGHWSAGNDDSKDKLNLDFGSNDPWEELNEDWRILERTNSKIRLQHTSGGDGSVDYLTFERN